MIYCLHLKFCLLAIKQDYQREHVTWSHDKFQSMVSRKNDQFLGPFLWFLIFFFFFFFVFDIWNWITIYCSVYFILWINLVLNFSLIIWSATGLKWFLFPLLPCGDKDITMANSSQNKVAIGAGSPMTSGAVSSPLLHGGFVSDGFAPLPASFLLWINMKDLPNIQLWDFPLFQCLLQVLEVLMPSTSSV